MRRWKEGGRIFKVVEIVFFLNFCGKKGLVYLRNKKVVSMVGDEWIKGGSGIR